MIASIKPSSLDVLPNEILHEILSYCPTTSVLILLRTCRRLNGLIDNRIWLRLCREEFKYWSQKYDFDGYLEDLNRVDWHGVFLERRRKQHETTELLESILRSQTGRIDKFQQIVSLGYDAKDCLLKHYNVGDNAEDCLARRWYSDAALGCIHRSMAINEWYRIYHKLEQSLEKALGAFDMFILHDRQGDFDGIRSRLDSISQAIVDETSEFHDKTVGQKALIIAAYLVRNRLVGIRGRADLNYHNMQNNFIGFALHDPDHSSLPLQSAAIYCSVARRLGVVASPCALPFHVFVVVRLSEDDGSNMYLDPFETDQEIDVSVLTSRLYSIGTPQEHHAIYLEPAPINDLILRTGRNIVTSIQDNYRRGTRNSALDIRDLEGAFYGALWSALLLSIRPGDGPLNTTLNRRAYLPHFVEYFETHFPMDAALIERYLIPTFGSLPESATLQESIHAMRKADTVPKTVKARTEEITEKVLYKVGQIFRHARYGYMAVITGWDIECNKNEEWMERMRVQELQRGQHQSFYNVLVEDKSVRYVAEENIDIVSSPDPGLLMSLAGRHFKRWDRQARRFVSNIKDEYPDD